MLLHLSTIKHGDDWGSSCLVHVFRSSSNARMIRVAIMTRNFGGTSHTIYIYVFLERVGRAYSGYVYGILCIHCMEGCTSCSRQRSAVNSTVRIALRIQNSCHIDT